MFNFLFVSPTSVTIELDNKDIFYSSSTYDVYLNNELVKKDVDTNIISLYDLIPNTEYVVKINDVEKTFKTKNVSVIFNIDDFGVYKDGINDDTKAINQAIMMLPDNGLLVISKGTYRVTSIFLKSNIYVEVKKDATLLAYEDFNKYPTFIGEVERFDKTDFVNIGQWEGNPSYMKASIISGYWLNNVSLYGLGVIDGNAQNGKWWEDYKKHPFARARLLFLDGCKNIDIQGLTFQNTPCWTLHPFYSDHLGFYDLRIYNPSYSPNTDGMDPEACDDVKIIGVRFSVGDDCIALKSSKINMGMRYKKPCSNFIIRNCLMKDGHGGVVLGSEMSGGIRDLTVERCIFLNTDRGLRIKTRRGRGKYCVVDGIEFSDILMKGVLTPLVINMFYFCDPDGKTEYVWSKDKLAVDDRTPYLGKFKFKRIKAYDSHWAAGYFYGLPEQPIGEIVIEDSTFTMKDNPSSGEPAMMSFAETCSQNGFCFNNVKKVVLKNVTLENQKGERFVTNNVESVEDL